LPLSLTFDHRAMDGAHAQRFLNELIAYLADPARLMLRL
jgi:pyruvate/2-oxoglutarate dehydrogenase complex dihydrolipoamide acyltransferase (E2) component